MCDAGRYYYAVSFGALSGMPVRGSCSRARGWLEQTPPF